MDAFELVGKLTLDSSGVVAGLKSTENTSAFSAWGVTVGSLAAKAFASTFSAATKFARSVFETGMEFDAMMSSVDAVKNMSEEEFTAIREQALELGRTTKYTATEVGEGLYYMGLAGWNSEEMMAGIPDVLRLAAASGESLGRASDIVTDALTALGYKASDTGRFVDAMAAAASNSNTTVGMMGEAFKYLATIGGTLNYSIEDVALTLGLLANNGIKSSQAGTSMRQILNTLIAPGDEAAEAMERLNISLFEKETGARKPLSQVLGELREVFKTSDFDLAGRSIEEIAKKQEELNAALDAGEISETDYATEMQNYLNFNSQFLKDLSDIGGLRGISSLLAIMKSNDEDFNQLVDSIYNSEGAAEKMQQKQIDNLKGDITMLNSALDGLKIIVSDKFKDNLREGTQVLTGWITTLADLIENGPGDTIERAQRKESEAITEANKTANEAQGIVGYMDELIAKFGDAATKTDEWKNALSNLESILPGISEHIKAEGEALGSTTDKMREYIEQSRQRATMEAKRKTISTYEEAYANALAGVQGAQVAVDIAQQQQAYAADQMMNILREYRTSQGAEFSQETEQLYRKMIQEGGTNKLRSDILYAGEELGKSYEELEALMQSYDMARQAEETNASQIEALTAEMERTSAALEIAQAALAEMETDTTQTGLNELASAASGLAGRLNSVVVPSFAGVSNQVALPKAKGDWYVPYDNYLASLHRGEMVLTASQARRYRDGDSGGSVDVGAMAQAMRSAIIGLSMEMNDETVGRVIGNSTTHTVNTNIGSINRRRRYGYGG